MRSGWMVLIFVFFLLTGCRSWWTDDRPAPVTPPYAMTSVDTPRRFSEAEAVNAAVSAISLRMAVSGLGPFSVRAAEPGHCSVLGLQVIDSLRKMKLSGPRAACRLILTDTRAEDGLWTLSLRETGAETIFFRKSFPLTGREEHP